MILTFKRFPKVKFPLFLLGSDNWFEVDGVLFLNDLVVDEKNMPGKTLGIRRVQSRRKDLFPLNKAIFTLSDLIQAKAKIFIDNEGNPFIYQKTYNSPLKCYKIKRIEQKEIASLLWLEGWPTPFTIPRPPLNSPRYVRMLHYKGVPWLVYDYVYNKVKNTYRRV